MEAIMLLQEPAPGPEALVPMTVTDLAEILFCSSVQPSEHAAAEEIRAAVTACLRNHHGDVLECAVELAEQYGEDPETTCSRMRWCRETVALAFA